jgi:hypothetical protein
MSKAKTYEEVVQETASQSIEGWENARVDECSFLPKTSHYNCTVNVDSHIVKGEHGDYDSLSIFGHRLQSLMDLMEGLGLSIGMIRQFENVDRNIELPRGIEISFNSVD